MRDKRWSRTWMNWFMMTVPSVLLVSGFVLVGGLGTGRGGVALAGTSRAAGSTSTSDTVTTVSSQGVTISTSVCAGPTLSGSLELNKPLVGEMTLGLFALSQHELPFARRFTDTGQRATATFTGSTGASFIFQVVPSGAVDYIVVVMPTSGPITDTSQLAESAVVPLCGTRKSTVTTTVTATVTSTSTDTTTINVIQTVTVTSQVVVTTCSGCCISQFVGVGNAGVHESLQCCAAARTTAASPDGAKSASGSASTSLSPHAAVRTRASKIRAGAC